MKNTDQTINKGPFNLQNLILTIGIIFVAFNLRPAITSVGPLIRLIRDDVNISNGTAGLLTSLPLITFAIVSPIVPKLSRKLTNEIALIIGLLLIIIGILIRSFAILTPLLLGTLIIGSGIAICNVLLPGIIKDNFPLKVALMTGIYSTAMNIFAASASGLSYPFTKMLNGNWQLSLQIWMIPAILAVLIWIYITRKNTVNNEGKQIQLESNNSANNRMWGSALAWQVATLLGLQSFLFYVTISWLPEMLISNGVSLTTAGWLLSFAQIIGLPASFLVPTFAGKVRSQSLIAVSMGLSAFFGYSGLLLGSSMPILIISITLIGITLNGGFALALTLLGLRAKTSEQASELSGMAQSIGYLLAAAGPFAIGIVFDLTTSWTVPLIVLILISTLIMIFGFLAGRNKYVLN
ncbi:CynX/NimT family MFS transporter [Oceanobacillus indicireducens]|uniref:Transporter YycB n=1 Tax=Oceanobacillus indicireducens TaxID=1004261 RepID=A0A917Y048_9BACI|nr:MFS transporter [Oceanobacillus indicireducens]GGN61332.1 putative transporter YycB [Oceanobacillus indicireducens]